MSEMQNYNKEAIARQKELVRDLCRALSCYHGFESDFDKALSNFDVKFLEEKYAQSFFDRAEKTKDLLKGKEVGQWEETLEKETLQLVFDPHPFVEIFNQISEEKGLDVRIYDTGPKSYFTSKIKAERFYAGDVLKIDDVTRIMVETNDPDTHAKICQFMVEIKPQNKITHPDAKLLPGFLSDIYKLQASDGKSSEIAFVPAGLLVSGKMTHNILRYLRATDNIQDSKLAEELYKKTCQNIKKEFEKVSEKLPLKEKDIKSLRMRKFNEQSAKKRLNSLRNRCLEETLKKTENKKWSKFRENQKRK